MIWFLVFFISLALFVPLCIWTSYDDFDHTVVQATSLTILVCTLVTGLICSIVAFIDMSTCQVDHINLEEQRQELELKGDLLTDNTSAAYVNEWVNQANEFNQKLVKEQAIVQTYGNRFTFHDSKIMEVKKVDIRKHLITVPAYRYILEKY